VISYQCRQEYYRSPHLCLLLGQDLKFKFRQGPKVARQQHLHHLEPSASAFERDLSLLTLQWTQLRQNGTVSISFHFLPFPKLKNKSVQPPSLCPMHLLHKVAHPATTALSMTTPAMSASQQTIQGPRSQEQREPINLMFSELTASSPCNVSDHFFAAIWAPT
jgi:hypothetical protein